MEKYIIKIKNARKKLKVIELCSNDFEMSYYNGFAYDFAEKLGELYETHKDSDIILRFVNCKNEPIRLNLLHGIEIFKNTYHLHNSAPVIL